MKRKTKHYFSDADATELLNLGKKMQKICMLFHQGLKAINQRLDKAKLPKEGRPIIDEIKKLGANLPKVNSYQVELGGLVMKYYKAVKEEEKQK